MSIDKLFYQSLFKHLFSDPCQVEYWDGDKERYGEGDPEFNLILHEPIPKAELIGDASLAFGEAYMHKKVEIEGSAQRVIESLYNNQESFLHKKTAYAKIARFFSNNLKRSRENVEHHYDIGNDFYRLWLDDTMTYSCAYFTSPQDSLTQAQQNKVRHILQKLNLREGQTLLDIGCGWGELIITAAREYRAKALGITLSTEQYQRVSERIREEGLGDLAEVQLLDYRGLKSRSFERVVSVGMIEHVGKEHLDEYFSTVNNLLPNGGVSLLHSITGPDEAATNSWIEKYIFPGGYIPSVQELITHMAAHRFFVLDVESLRQHYARTLEHWASNFEKALPAIRQTKDETFIRMWRLYLNASAASFQCGNIDVHQFLFSKGVNNEWPWTRDYMYQP